MPRLCSRKYSRTNVTASKRCEGPTAARRGSIAKCDAKSSARAAEATKRKQSPKPPTKAELSDQATHEPVEDPPAKAQESTDKDVADNPAPVEIDAAVLADSREVDRRVQPIDDLERLQRELEIAGNRLVILEVMADGVCETGIFEPDDGWTPDWDEKQKAKLAVCENVRHAFVRMATDTPNVRFLETLQEGDASSDLCKHLDITHFPTVCFFKNKVLVWKTYGAAALTSDTNEGLLYFSENSQLKSSDHVRELDTEQGYDSFMASEGIEKPADVKIVMFSTPMCTPCIHVYPSFVTLAMNFKGIADFARVDMEDSATERQPLFERLRILEVPTFVLFFRGKEISRTVSSQRGDLIGHVLQTVMKLGITPPAPKRN